MTNFREQQWAGKTKSAGPKDLIIMHPNHVRGFLIESRFSGRSVQWISQPITGKTYRRLKSKERRSMRRLQQKTPSRRARNLR